MRPWQNKIGQWILPIKLDNLSGKSNSNYDEEVVIANDYFVFNYFIDQQEGLAIDGGDSDGGITPPVS